MSYRARAADFGGFLDATVRIVKYLIGSHGQICTHSLVNARLNDPRYKNYHDNIRKYGYKNVGEIVADCLGWLEMFWNGGSATRPLTKWIYPDITTSMILEIVKDLGLPTGPISTLPKNCPYPLAVCYSGHVGFFYHGKVYQSAGHSVGTIITDLSDTRYNKPWKTWYMIPYLDYEGWMPGSDQVGEEVTEMINILGKGPEVAEVQKALIALGYQGDMNPALIGSGGPKTRAALIAFQKHSGISQTGIVDEATQAALLKGLSSRSAKTDYKKLYETEKARATRLQAKVSAALAALN
jgi:hypothetical protein